MANFATLLIGGILLTHFSYAWINHNRYVDKIKLQTGTAQAEVSAYMFKRRYDDVAPYVNQTPELTATQLHENSGQLIFSFNDTTGAVFSPLQLETLFNNEHSLNSWALPSYFVELQLSSIAPISYVRISLKVLDYLVNETVPHFTNFSYRYALISNNVNSPLSYATSSTNFVTDLNTQGLTNIESGITNYQVSPDDQIYNSSTGRLIDEDNSGQISLSVSPENMSFYQSHFIKSVVIELTPDPLEFVSFLQNNHDIAANNLLIGKKLAFDFSYSLTEFEA